MLAPRFVTSESDPLVAIADAVVVLVHEHAGKRVLAVHRREQPEWRCLPGGRIERRESAREAARRELAEETGLQLYRHELTFLGASDLETVESCVTVAVFEAWAPAPWDPSPNRHEPELRPHWASLAELCDDSNGPFAASAKFAAWRAGL
jgi:8-oxo-dGTP pyrophosphatase MutT (NUDIX family)